MATNLALDDKLINEAVHIGSHKSKKEAVTVALIEYIQHRKQLKLIDLFGKIDYYDDYDYKKMRTRNKDHKE